MRRLSRSMLLQSTLLGLSTSSSSLSELSSSWSLAWGGSVFVTAGAPEEDTDRLLGGPACFCALRFAAVSFLFSARCAACARFSSRCFPSTRRIAIAVLSAPLAARPKRCHKLQSVIFVFHWTTMSMSGKSRPCCNYPQ